LEDSQHNIYDILYSDKSNFNLQLHV